MSLVTRNSEIYWTKSNVKQINDSIFCCLLEEKLLEQTVTLPRSNRPEVFCKKGVLWNFVKLTGKHLCQSLFLKKRLWRRCFPGNFTKFLRTPLYREDLWWLFLLLITFQNCTISKSQTKQIRRSISQRHSFCDLMNNSIWY